MALLLGFLSPPAWSSGPEVLAPEFFVTPVDRQALIVGSSFSASDRFSRTLLYLHLSGRFTDEHRQLFLRYLDRPRAAPAGNTAYEWRQLVMTATGNPYDFFGRQLVSREITRNGVRVVERFYFDNCLDDAFATAVATFNDRRQRYGANSEAFRRWLAAQQQVFAFCSATALPPLALPDDSWSLLEQQDRRYQIAASLFYDQQYLEAAQRFREIAADTASPWADISRYLVARSLLYQATRNSSDVETNLRAALEQYRELAADPAFLTRYPTVTGLIRYIEIQLDTPGFQREMARRILERPAEVDAGALDDFLYLTEHGGFDSSGDGAGEEDLLRWHRLAANSGVPAPGEIATLWRDTGNPAWLYLALSRGVPIGGVAQLDTYRADLAALDPATPAYADMRVRLANLYRTAGNIDGARELAQETLGDDRLDLVLAQRNSLQYLLAAASADPIEHLRLAQLTPAALSSSNRGWAAADALRQATRGAELFPDETVTAINRSYTPAMLLDAAERIPFNDYLEGRLVITAWVRAILTADVPAARRGAEHLKSAFPELEAELNLYLAGEDSNFVVARIMLMHPGFSPWMPYGIGRYRGSDTGPGLIFPSAQVALGMRSYNWWCRESPDMPSVTEFFGPMVIEYARANPDDARVPQTLHRLVFATRYACETGPGEISREAFQILHSQYPDSEWAEQTPYWFE